MERPVYRIAYICSQGHSGSTLLDLLIGAHSRAVSAGELKRFSPTRYESHWRSKGWPEITSTPCTCGVDISACDFWSRVGDRVQAGISVALQDLDIYAHDPLRFSSHNVALFDAIAAESGADIIVDSSKDLERLNRLLEVPELDVRPIHLVRSPEGVVASYVKKGHHRTAAEIQYAVSRLSRIRALEKTMHHALGYEQLSANPVSVLKLLMAWLGLEFEPHQLHFRNGVRHLAGGNRMRFETEERIMLDRSWRTVLGPIGRWRTRLFTLPARRGWMFALPFYGLLLRRARVRPTECTSAPGDQ